MEMLLILMQSYLNTITSDSNPTNKIEALMDLADLAEFINAEMIRKHTWNK